MSECESQSIIGADTCNNVNSKNTDGLMNMDSDTINNPLMSSSVQGAPTSNPIQEQSTQLLQKVEQDDNGKAPDPPVISSAKPPCPMTELLIFRDNI